MRTQRWVKHAALLVGTVLLAAACGGSGGGSSSSEGSGGPPVVRLQALSGGLTAVALKVIEQNGFDKKNGFKGEYFYEDPDAASQFFLQKHSDISFDQDPLNVAIAREQGIDVTTFYSVLPNNNCILVKNDSPFKSPRDLIGHKVGHFGTDSGTTTSLTIMLQEFYGFNLLDEYNLVESDPATLVELLDKGDVDAIFDFVPHSTRAEVQADARCLFGPAVDEWEQREGGVNLLTSMAAYEDWLTEHVDEAEGVMRAWDDAYEWLTEDPTRITKPPYSTLMAQDDPKVLEQIGKQVGDIPLFTNDWSEATRQAAEKEVELAAEQDILIKEAPDGVVSTIDDFKK